MRRILAEAGAHLTEEGALVCEVGRARARLEADYPDLPLLWLDTEESEAEGEVFVLRRRSRRAAPRAQASPLIGFRSDCALALRGEWNLVARHRQGCRLDQRRRRKQSSPDPSPRPAEFGLASCRSAREEIGPCDEIGHS